MERGSGKNGLSGARLRLGAVRYVADMPGRCKKLFPSILYVLILSIRRSRRMPRAHPPVPPIHSTRQRQHPAEPGDPEEEEGQAGPAFIMWKFAGCLFTSIILAGCMNNSHKLRPDAVSAHPDGAYGSKHEEQDKTLAIIARGTSTLTRLAVERRLPSFAPIQYRKHMTMPDYHDIKRLVDRARAHVAEIAPAEARRRIAAGAIPIDVRDEEELLRNPPLAGAVHLSRGRLEYLISDAVPGKDAAIVLYCAGGLRSVLAAENLQLLGYSGVAVLAGGLQAWRSDAGQPWIAALSETAGRCAA